MAGAPGSLVGSTASTIRQDRLWPAALLVSELAFPEQSEAAEHAKTGVLIGSVLAAVLAAISLGRRNRARRRIAHRGIGYDNTPGTTDGRWRS